MLLYPALPPTTISDLEKGRNGEKQHHCTTILLLFVHGAHVSTFDLHRGCLKKLAVFLSFALKLRDVVGKI